MRCCVTAAASQPLQHLRLDVRFVGASRPDELPSAFLRHIERLMEQTLDTIPSLGVHTVGDPSTGATDLER